MTDLWTQLECQTTLNKYNILTISTIKRQRHFCPSCELELQQWRRRRSCSVSHHENPRHPCHGVPLRRSEKTLITNFLYLSFASHILLRRLPLWWYSWACPTAGSSSSWWMCTRPLPSGFPSSLLAPDSPTWGKCSNSTLTEFVRVLRNIKVPK